jgi:hypothetical protein
MNGDQWKWTQRPDFTHPEHPEWDLIQWDLEDELVKDPRAVAGRLIGGGEFYYFFTKDAPGLGHLPPMVVFFRIACEPTASSPGEIEGIGVWEDDDLLASLMARLRSG